MPGMWVDLDPEVHEAVERRWRRHRESVNDLLRRSMGLDRVERPAEPGAEPWGEPWRGGGVTLPHGTELRMSRAGRTWFGTVRHGEWLVGRGRFAGPEAAARWVSCRHGDRTARPDPWLAWTVRFPRGRSWRTLASLRDR